MNKRLIAPLALVLLSGALCVRADTPPFAHLQGGEWSYHSVITFTSGVMVGRTATNGWKTCAREGQAGEAAMKPHSASGDASCSVPTRSHDKTGYRSVMTCTTTAQGIPSTIKEDFTLNPGNGGRSFKAHGTVEQRMDVPGMSSRTTQMTIDIDGHRTGTCSAD